MIRLVGCQLHRYPTSSTILVLILLLSSSAVVLSRFWGVGRRERFLPPGPPTKFLLGNASDFPRFTSFVQFTRWAAEYGQLVSLKILDRNMVILSNAPTMKEILDKQGLLSGDRPQVYLIQRAEGVYPILIAVCSEGVGKSIIRS
ncbi:hypothetical protein PC9H_007702 [Pleurotus ostreatus]|uniref:Uncharacterized protein n=1 Tax=Pleurotus ostreatus TaxID=5322 RepID=A0A8H7DUH9_PLEOS|nr:uncharacterized protein PC9H_007702 [Pleurotus ostreatus]KAF7428478.1 hypothetical protein PC9H_007702 [Pleurotus ostreatus]